MMRESDVGAIRHFKTEKMRSRSLTENGVDVP